MKWFDMHTTETKWQDASLETAQRLKEAADGWPIGYADYLKAAATIEALVQALEQKIKDIDSLEPSE